MRTKFSLINNYKKEIFFYLLFGITMLFLIFGNKVKISNYDLIGADFFKYDANGDLKQGHLMFK